MMPSSFYENRSTLSENQSVAFCFSNSRPPFKHSTNLTITSAYFSAVFTILGLGSNLFAFLVLLKAFYHNKSQSRSSFLLFLCGLVVTDFMGLLVTGSIVISFHVTHFNWMLLDPNCHFCNFMGMSMVFYGLSPLLLGATMAVERFVGINLPFIRSANVSKSRACYMVAGVWVIAGFIGLLPLLGLGRYHIQLPGSWCFLNISHMPLDKAFSLIFSLRKRQYEVEMMVQLILIMVIATICWCPLFVFIAQTVFLVEKLHVPHLLLWIRFATWNQILDPWVYILFRRSILKRIYPRMDWSRGSISSLSISVGPLTRIGSLEGTGRGAEPEFNGQNCK
ncbi:thromboxane A2 receptor isoform X2 [Hoplias malabaricus]|uniref:thromboxane A2 receptor isoform X2 n=1 Tax=Hoplias malabaricus TaxID=27720 RepID=UPI003461C1DC